MRVTCLIDHLACGGAQRQLCLLAGLLQQRGHTVNVLTYHASNEFFRASVEREQIPVEAVLTKTKLGRIWAVRSAIRSGQPDVVIAYLPTPNLLAEVSGLPARNYAVIVSERSLDAGGPTVRSFLRCQLHRLADAIVTNSHAQAEFIAQHAPYLRNELRVITNCVDLQRFHPPARRPHSMVTRLLVLANFAAYKNPVNFGRAVSLARRRLPEGAFQVHWYGNNFFRHGRPTPESSEFLQLQRLIGVERLADYLHLHPPTPDVVAQYHGACAVCLPSLTEGFPNVIGEAMACGLPILASRAGDNERLVLPGENGWLFNPHSPEEMAESIVQFVQTPQRVRQALGQASRDRAVVMLSPEVFIQRYEQLLTEVCSARRCARRTA